jgi:hypothetical protein
LTEPLSEYLPSPVAGPARLSKNAGTNVGVIDGVGVTVGVIVGVGVCDFVGVFVGV